ncbi:MULTISPECIES: hypothetical protein [unclassified Marinitoga]|uniref:hypothetical protein n=1 Tax=unclassified Marinitoga TaxID=2640159 RepID=UPI0006410248|nr:MULTISPECIES: hypothetical protein [unclassified Marinitoga]KLO21231.1 hypothetical protein X274_11145 [Marinitoga sp. 1155]NUU99578.1 hypothetical protein [Marinitoga sp. 1154]
MFRKFISYTIILLFISIISTLYPDINHIISRANHPLDIVFFEIRNNYLLLTKNADYLKTLENAISKNSKSIYIKNMEFEVSIELIPGIFINEDGKYYYIKSDEKVKKGEIVFTKDGILLGFVYDTFKKEKIIQKFGWGNHEIFGVYKNTELLIKESGNGNIIINIPEGMELFKNKENVSILISNSNWFNKNLILKGVVYKKSNTIYYLKPDKINSIVVFFSEFGVR